MKVVKFILISTISLILFLAVIYLLMVGIYVIGGGH